MSSKGIGPEEWIKFVEKESRDLGIPLINVLQHISNVVPTKANSKLFIPEGQVNYPFAAYISMIRAMSS